MLRATLRSLLARKLRLALSGLAIVLGIGFVSGAFVLTDTLGQVFDRLFSSVSIRTDAVVQGRPVLEGSSERAPVDAALVAQVRAVDGVEAATGAVSGLAQVIRKDGTLYSTGGAPTFGQNFDPQPALSPYTLRSGSGPDQPDEIALDATTAKGTGYVVGDTVPVVTRSGRADYTVSGIFGFGDNDNLGGASIVTFDPAVASSLVAVPGEVEQITVAARGVSQSELADRIRAALPPDVEVLTGAAAAEQQASDLKDLFGFFTIFLLAFAGVALFVGAFLIFNTFTILVAQRTRELALMRALGASRAQVTGSVLLEALVVGLIASLVGLLSGIGVALGLRALVNGITGGALPTGALVVAPRTVVVCLIAGVGVTAVASLLPARRASAVPPVAALSQAADAGVEGSGRRGTIAGAVLLVAGVAALVPGLRGALSLLALGAALLFLGVVALSPLVARPVTGLLGRPLARGVPGRLGRGNAMRSPRRTATTAGALMVGLALVSAVTVLGASVKASVTDVVEKSFGADLVVQSEGFQGLSPAVVTAVDTLPPVGQVDALWVGQAGMDGRTVQASAVPPRALGTSFLLTQDEGSLADLGPTTLLVSRSEADDHRLRVGSPVAVTLPRGQSGTRTVAGIYTDSALAGGYLLDDTAAPGFTVDLPQVVLVRAAPGATAADLRSAVDAAVTPFPGTRVQDRQEFVDAQAGQVDTLLAIVYALLALSVVIAVLGIVNTLALSVVERTRELGLLRAVGLDRRRMRRMVRVEAVLVALFGGLLGVILGTGIGIAVQRALAGQGVAVLRVPVGQLALFLVLASLAGVLAAVLPARRAARLDVLEALAST